MLTIFCYCSSIFFVLHDQFQVGFEGGNPESLCVWKCPFVFLVDLLVHNHFSSIWNILFHFWLMRSDIGHISLPYVICFVFLEALRNFLFLVFWNFTCLCLGIGYFPTFANLDRKFISLSILPPLLFWWISFRFVGTNQDNIHHPQNFLLPLYNPPLYLPSLHAKIDLLFDTLVCVFSNFKYMESCSVYFGGWGSRRRLLSFSIMILRNSSWTVLI